VPRQTYGYLPSRRGSPLLDRYQIILPGDRGTCTRLARTTFPRLLFESGTVGTSCVTSHRQPRQCPGAQNYKGGPKWPELCIKTVIRLCAGIAHNHHPCLLTWPSRAGRYLLFRNLFLILWFRSYSDVIVGGLGPVANVCRGPKNFIDTPLVGTQKNPAT